MPKNKPEKKSSFELLKEAANRVDFPQAAPVFANVDLLNITPSEAWQIVVVGAIDARQHHPLWYRQIGCIDDSELASATKSSAGVLPPIAIGTPQISFIQFDAGPFTISVVQDRWIIQTVLDAHRKRIIEATSLVFKKLWEVPITAYGVNRVRSVRLKGKTAKQFLADSLGESGLAFGRGNNAEAQITYTQHLDSLDVVITLAASPTSEKWINIVYNRHHPLGGRVGYFDLGEDINNFAEIDWRAADEYASDLAQCIAIAEGK